MGTENKDRISISRENLPKVIAKAFSLSNPQGLGFLHFQPGEIPDDVLNQILIYADEAGYPYGKNISLDYVQGRAVKLRIPYDESGNQWHLEGDRWYDHGMEEWQELKEYAASLN
jgi:hypothetical protein